MRASWEGVLNCLSPEEFAVVLDACIRGSFAAGLVGCCAGAICRFFIDGFRRLALCEGE